MLRERTLGNSSTRLAKQLRENHGEEWLQCVARYLEVCADFVDQPSLFPVVCQEPPEPVAVPTNRWLLTVYGKDLMSRMDHIKASITSTFGAILKMDSALLPSPKLNPTPVHPPLCLLSPQQCLHMPPPEKKRHITGLGKQTNAESVGSPGLHLLDTASSGGPFTAPQLSR